MGDLSRHFSRSEFADHETGEVVVDPRLIEALELLRSRVGRPLRVISGYRSPAHNRAVHGAPRSQHMAGTAADIPPYYATVAQAAAVGFTGIGMKRDPRTGIDWATHVDVRRGRPARWRYKPL